jgi:polyhydroxyalkanoate synthesis repressor PhaR
VIAKSDQTSIEYYQDIITSPKSLYQPRKKEAIMTETKGQKTRGENDPIIIKKYANRRLYNTASSTYVTLDNLGEMVRAGVDFVVYDAKSGEDITRSVLTQIIFDEEARGQNLLPIQFLRQLIGFYGDQMQSLVPSYLEMSLDSFTKSQERFKEQMTTAMGVSGLSGPAAIMSMFDDPVKKNMALFDNALKLWTSMGANNPLMQNPIMNNTMMANPMMNPLMQQMMQQMMGTTPSESASPPTQSQNQHDDVKTLREQMDMMKKRLDELDSKS